MRRKLVLLAVLAFAVNLIVSAPASAAESSVNQSRSTSPRESSEPAISVTRHSIRVGGNELSYTATTGYIRLMSEEEKPRADMFFVSYTLDGAEARKRPVTFVFNGGPGAASVWLHMGAVGPMRVPLPQDPGAVVSNTSLRENEQTWLTVSDLVFIDPIGTGYSRPTQNESGKQFWGTSEDIASIAEFIRLYTTRSGRWGSLKFLAGESYGTLRAVGLADYLYQNYGMEVDGLVLISLAIDFQTFSFSPGSDTPYIAYMPTYAAIAKYHGKSGAQTQTDTRALLREVEEWTLTEYVPALSRGSLVSDEVRERVAQTMSEYIGLPKSYILKQNLRVNRTEFMQELLHEKGMSPGLLDGRGVKHGSPADFLNDPGVVGTVSPFVASLNDYIRKDLNFKTDLSYIFLSEEANAHWNWGSNPVGAVNGTRTLHDIIQRHSSLKVLIAAGCYDLDTPYFGTAYTVSHLGLDPGLRQNIRMEVFEAGHMLYTHEPSLQKLTSDFMEMVSSASAGRDLTVMMPPNGSPGAGSPGDTGPMLK